jgi:hypothetical protein
MIEWKVNHCEWSSAFTDIEEGHVKVTTLHWTCNVREGDQNASSYGTANVGEQGREFHLEVLEAVPTDEMVVWLKSALGEEEVAQIESLVAAQLAEQVNPTSGGFQPPAE